MCDDIVNALPSNLRTRLDMVIQEVPRFWERERYKHFTNHGPIHSQRVCQKLVQLGGELPEAYRLNSDEVYVLLVAAWLYETGLQSPGLRPVVDIDYLPGDSLLPSQLQRIRAKKHLLSERLIMDSVRGDYQGPQLHLGLLRPPDDYTRLVAEVCRWCSDEPLQDVPNTMPVNGMDVRVRLLVALLRLADQLDIDQTRVNFELLERADLPKRQYARWWAYQYVQTLPIKKGQIRFHYYLPASQEEYLGYIRILFEPDFEYDNNPNIRYLWDEYAVRLMPHRVPGITFDPPGFRREMGPELLEYLRREFTLPEKRLGKPDQVSGLSPTNLVHNDVGGEMTTILFLAANPLDTDPLRLDEEIRAIDEALRKAEFRDRFDIEQHWAVRVKDLQAHLLRHKPQIVHFSGHGSTSSEIVLEDSSGIGQPVSGRALSTLFGLLKDEIRCVVLNTCYSERQAKAIAKHIDCVIGMSESIGDSTAISFAAAFYQALGFGKDIETAFRLGCAQVDLEGIDEHDAPQLLCTKVNPKEITFVPMP